jgi:hypothetical protein
MHMGLFYRVTLVLVLLAIAGSLAKNLTLMAGAPNWVPMVRDPLLIALAVFGISKLPIFSQTVWRWFLLALLTFVVSYIGVSMAQDRAIMGLYYLRVYFLPFLFTLGFLGLLQHLANRRAGPALIRFTMWTHFLLFVVAVVLYVLLLELPAWRPRLFGSDLLPTAWYISGGSFMRMGLPAAGPNNLGLIFAANGIFFMAMRLCWPPSKQSGRPSNFALTVATAVCLLGIIMTFSRSSLLMLLLGALMLLLLPGVLTFARLFRVLRVLLIFLTLLLMFGMGFDIYSDGYITRWLELNFSGKDPSAIGHQRSIQLALQNWADYVLVGYPRGTVGPKAQLFTGNFMNVESGFLGLIYDMGLFNGVPYAVAVGTLLAAGFRHRAQLALLFAFAAPMALLPYIFEPDVLTYFLFIYCLMGYVLPPIGARPMRLSAASDSPTPGAVQRA